MDTTSAVAVSPCPDERGWIYRNSAVANSGSIALGIKAVSRKT